VSTKLVWLLAGALATGLIAAGCGDDDEKQVAAAALSKSEFIAQADAICKKGDKEIDQAGRESFAGGAGKPTPEQSEAFATDVVLPNIQGQVDGVRALGAPEGDEAEIDAFLNAAQDGIDQSEDDPSVLFGNGEGPSGFLEAERLAGEYGFQVCAA